MNATTANLTNAIEPTVRRTSFARGSARFDPIPLLAFACVAVYVLRTSLLAYLSNSTLIDLITQATVATLFVTVAYVASAGIGRLNRWGLLLIAATGISLLNCESVDFAYPRWIGWVSMLWALGPVNSTLRARQLRLRMLSATGSGFLLITVLSVAWWAVGLPNLGRGDFTGVMWHSMVLGPIAAYVGVICLVRIFSNGSLLWCAMYAVSWMVAMLASSRSALAALAIGSLAVMAIKLKRNPAISSAALALALLLAVAPETSLSFCSQLLPQQLTAGLSTKSWNNSRELHWNARWEEFESAPLTGVGFASAWNDTIGVDSDTGTVESGSSYIAVLSMTGWLGAAACLALATTLGLRVFRCWRFISERQRLELGGIAAFWAVHLGAEGYIYAVGSLMGVTFWLWVGCLDDQLVSLATPAGYSTRFRRTGARRLPSDTIGVESSLSSRSQGARP